ncbi:WAP four-disulfide core domain protein 18-like [Trichechus inunguis]
MKTGIVLVLVVFITLGMEMACAIRPPTTGRGRPGVCPEVPKNVFGICVEECSGDESCPRGKKCCSNGCGHVCTSPVTRVSINQSRVVRGGRQVPSELCSKRNGLEAKGRRTSGCSI